MSKEDVIEYCIYFSMFILSAVVTALAATLILYLLFLVARI